MPLITRRPKTVQTTPKVTARPFLEEFTEAMLGFGVEFEEGREDVEEVDDDDDDVDDVDDDDGMSFASRTVNLEIFLNFANARR
jgi:hypothetical protein